MNDILGEIEQAIPGTLSHHSNYRQTVEFIRGMIEREDGGRSPNNSLQLDIQTKLATDWLLAKKLGARLNERMDMTLSKAELGFLALHLSLLRGTVNK